MALNLVLKELHAHFEEKNFDEAFKEVMKNEALMAAVIGLALKEYAERLEDELEYNS